MKAKALKSASINYLGRTVSVVEGMVYDFKDAGLINLLLNEKIISIVEEPVEREYKKGKALVSDREQISMEKHEQEYMKNKIKDMTKDNLLKLYEMTEKELGSEDVKVLDKEKKDEIIKTVTENFAKINERKVVNKMIKEIKEEQDGFKNLSQ